MWMAVNSVIPTLTSLILSTGAEKPNNTPLHAFTLTFYNLIDVTH